jgi:hypothetical protein
MRSPPFFVFRRICHKKTPPLLGNGVYPNFQTMQPPGYKELVKAMVDEIGQNRLGGFEGIVFKLARQVKQ